MFQESIKTVFSLTSPSSNFRLAVQGEEEKETRVKPVILTYFVAWVHYFSLDSVVKRKGLLT